MNSGVPAPWRQDISHLLPLYDYLTAPFQHYWVVSTDYYSCKQCLPNQFIFHAYVGLVTTATSCYSYGSNRLHLHSCTDWTMIFARWCQCAHPSNTCTRFLGPTRDYSPDQHLDWFRHLCRAHPFTQRYEEDPKVKNGWFGIVRITRSLAMSPFNTAYSTYNFLVTMHVLYCSRDINIDLRQTDRVRNRKKERHVDTGHRVYCAKTSLCSKNQRC